MRTNLLIGAMALALTLGGAAPAFAQAPNNDGTHPSPDGWTVTDNTGAIYGSDLSFYALSANGQVVVNAYPADPSTSDVKELVYSGGKVWYVTNQCVWYDRTTPSDPGWAKQAAGPAGITVPGCPLQPPPPPVSNNPLMVVGRALAYLPGDGSIDVYGAPSPVFYAFHAGNGELVIEDYSEAKGDKLMVDASLQASMKTATVSGDFLIMFNGSPVASILLRGTTTAPNIAWTK